MQAYQAEFFDFILATGALRFGEFKLKSGRISPYFFNAGFFSDGRSASRLGYYYASAITHSHRRIDLIYGPAYKGIPLVTATAIALQRDYHINLAFAFNRKEIKDHGEGGQIVGAKLKGNIAIIDDVVTAGISVSECIDIIRAAGATVDSVFISLDRQERLVDAVQSASQWIEQEQGIPVFAIASFGNLIDYLQQKSEYARHLAAMEAYRERYGA